MKKLYQLKAILLFACALLIFGCNHQHSQKFPGASKEFPLGKLEMQALGGGACSSPIYIAKERGYFAREGLDVTLLAGDLETQKTGLTTGRFSVALGDFYFFPSIYNGLELKLIAGLHEGCIKLLVPPGSPIKEAKDLIGKNIGVDEIGGTPMAVASVYLANYGVDPRKEVIWRPYPRDILPEVGDKGFVDALAVWDPFATLLEKRGYYTLCDIGTHPLFAGKSCCFLYASKKHLQEYPERVKALLTAIQKSSQWVANNPEETARIVINKKYIAAGDTSLLTELILSYKYHAKHSSHTREKAKSDALYFANELKKTGYLPEDLNSEEFIENLYYEVRTDIEEDTHGMKAMSH